MAETPQGQERDSQPAGKWVERPWLSVAEAARELGVVETTLVTAIDQGRIDAVRLGTSHRATRIHRHTLMPWLKGDYARLQSAARTSQVVRMRDQRLVVERLESELEHERRWLVDLMREVEHDAIEADDGTRRPQAV